MPDDAEVRPEGGTCESCEDREADARIERWLDEDAELRRALATPVALDVLNGLLVLAARVVWRMGGFVRWLGRGVQRFGAWMAEWHVTGGRRAAAARGDDRVAQGYPARTEGMLGVRGAPRRRPGASR